MFVPQLANTGSMYKASKRFTDLATGKRLQAFSNDLKEQSKELESLIDEGRSGAADVFKVPMKIASALLPIPGAIGSLFEKDESKQQSDSGSQDNTSSKEMGEAFRRKMFKDCIPCDFRSIGEEFARWGKDAKGLLTNPFDSVREAFEKFWRETIAQINEMINMLKGIGQYIDPCAFIEFMLNWVCFPDLFTMLAALSALLQDISIVLDGMLIDLVLSFVAPLIMPILQEFVNLLIQFMNLILKPIQCIINAIINFSRKLDWSSFKLPDFRLRGPAPMQMFYRDPKKNGEIPTDEQLKTFDTNKYHLGSINASTPSHPTDAGWKTKSLDETGGGRKAFNAGVDKSAKLMKDNADWGRRFGGMLQSFTNDIASFLQQSATRFQQLANTAVGEFMKLVEEYCVGYSKSTGRAQAQKLALIRLIAAIATIINAMKGSPNCDKEDLKRIVESNMANKYAQDKGWKVWTGPDGEVHIDEPDEQIDPIRDILAPLITPPLNYETVPGGQRPAVPSSATTLSTGDPVIDPYLAGIVDTLVTPSRIVFGCQFNNTGIIGIEQINDWISGE